jgi:hypothetical protein
MFNILQPKAKGEYYEIVIDLLHKSQLLQHNKESKHTNSIEQKPITKKKDYVNRA